MTNFCLFIFSMAILLNPSYVSAAPDPNFHIYLVFGQSNMAGGCNKPDALQESLDFKKEDCDTTERIKVLAFKTCRKISGPCRELGYKLNRNESQWYTAFPPYHNCGEGVGPSDYFGKTLLDSIKDNISLGFIPCALSGQSIDVFVKGSNKKPDSWAHGNIKGHAYDWMLNRCKLAQEKGVIKGLLFHQGESDNGQASWVGKLKSVFDNLKKDLNLKTDIPIVVGELLQDEGACCTQHNKLVHQVAAEYPNCGLASSKDLKMRPSDKWNAHFDCAGMRELGRRFAVEFLKMADNSYIPRKNVVPAAPKSKKSPSFAALRSWNDGLRIYTFNGKFISEVESLADSGEWRKRNPRNSYIIYQKSSRTGKIIAGYK